MSAFRMDMDIGTDRTWKGDSELWINVNYSDVVARLAVKNLTASGRDEMSGSELQVLRIIHILQY